MRRKLNWIPCSTGILACVLRCTAKRYLVFVLLTLLAFAQRKPDRSLSDRASQLNTDQQIALYQKQTAAQPSNPHLQNLLASAYIQKLRESTDFTYLDRASKIVDGVLSTVAGNYEAMRLR